MDELLVGVQLSSSFVVSPGRMVRLMSLGT
jgi:hypothetical protein